MRNRTGYASDRLSRFSIALEHNNIVSCVHYNITCSVYVMCGGNFIVEGG